MASVRPGPRAGRVMPLLLLAFAALLLAHGLDGGGTHITASVATPPHHAAHSGHAVGAHHGDGPGAPDQHHAGIDCLAMLLSLALMAGAARRAAWRLPSVVGAPRRRRVPPLRRVRPRAPPTLAALSLMRV